MARNEEKANTMLRKFMDAKAERLGLAKEKKKRPAIASECRDLSEADRWRAQILREIGKKVMEVQNAGLGEGILRDLNDEINKLVREKRHWEIRIRDLGGRDYTKMTSNDADGEAYSHGLVYRYYGAAKNLPGVKELLATRAAEQREREHIKEFKRTRAELYRGLDCNYYGFRDDEDGVLEIQEGEAELKARKILIEKALSNSSTNGSRTARADRTSAELDKNSVDDEAQEINDATLSADTLKINPSENSFVSHVPLPDEREIEKMVIQKKKRELLEQYASKDLQESEREAKTMLNKKS